MDLNEGRIEANGVLFAYLEAGPADGPLALCLHGFPDTAWTWRHLLPELAEAGYLAVAPFMRGYAPTEVPADGRYQSGALVADACALHEALDGDGRAVIVGHDWGAQVAWETAMRHPSRVDRLAILNVPHPVRMLEGLRTLRQLRRSWYMFFFQHPFVPEAALRAGDFAIPRRVLRRDSVSPDAFSEEDIERFVDAWSQPGALTAMLAYYRAAVRSPAAIRGVLGRGDGAPGVRVVEAPTLVIWGERDTALGTELAEPDRRWVPNLIGVERLPDASHWVQNDAPERVNELLINFLR